MRRTDFLKQLTALCKQAGYRIGGCGCCSSPYVMEYDWPEGIHYICDEDGGYLGVDK